MFSNLSKNNPISEATVALLSAHVQIISLQRILNFCGFIVEPACGKRDVLLVIRMLVISTMCMHGSFTRLDVNQSRLNFFINLCVDLQNNLARLFSRISRSAIWKFL